jgi:hypothetical protein
VGLRTYHHPLIVKKKGIEGLLRKLKEEGPL